MRMENQKLLPKSTFATRKTLLVKGKDEREEWMELGCKKFGLSSITPYLVLGPGEYIHSSFFLFPHLMSSKIKYLKMRVHSNLPQVF